MKTILINFNQSDKSIQKSTKIYSFTDDTPWSLLDETNLHC